MTQLKISPNDLICMNDHDNTNHFRVNLAYARDDNLLFNERIYRTGAKLYLHQTLAQITLRAASQCFENTGLNFILYDGLRTVNAQEDMMKTKRALENPHWLEEPRLLSKPGGGGHPRAMAVDIGLEDAKGRLINMGCPFDFLSDSPYADKNPAHREFKHDKNILNNRKIINDHMLESAKYYEQDLLLLPEEWWDFRLTPELFGKYAPLWDTDLPAYMRLTNI